ncbi:hypothetical protein [Kitasatospora acidiphila]|uniref:hypothetical protein n=1 Tax=Kitasatospora acidiphila TaxID=2567942 RepID=UPI0015F08843|nr:hypothetical protein [Kitasatospora acidiphila]
MSAVGDFKVWTARRPDLGPREDVMRSVTVAMPTAARVRFHHLAEGGSWFDDQEG